MYMSDIRCNLCGSNAMEASERGAYLKRVSQKGEGHSLIVECAPCCDRKIGNQDDALINAIESAGE